MTVSISKLAHKNIDSIYRYIAERSLQYANKTILEIYKYIYDLAASPYIGRYVPEFKNKTFRERIYKNYRIIYFVLDKENLVGIVSIVHTRRDLMEISSFKFNEF